MNNKYKSILAGLCIGLGAFANLMIGEIPGAIGFTLGLLCIVSLDFNLFTGLIGLLDFTKVIKNTLDLKPVRIINIPDIVLLFRSILFWNILGVFLMSVIIKFSGIDISNVAYELIKTRLSLSWFNAFFRAVGCGIIMDFIVTSYREKNTYLPILFGVPVFILCGFLHSIAEPFYLFTALSLMTTSEILRFILIYTAVILGNFIGCRLRKTGL